MADVHLEKTGEIVCLPDGGREERWRSVKTSSCAMGWDGEGVVPGKSPPLSQCRGLGKSVAEQKV